MKEVLIIPFFSVIALFLVNANATALHDIVTSMPPNSWQKVNINNIQDVFSSPDQRPSDILGTSPISPSSIIKAWGGATWDSNRGDLIVFGGEGSSFCCYPGNEVYRWHSSTLLWERASLSSELRLDDDDKPYPVDGPEHSPMAGESFDALAFLPLLDRMVVFGLGTTGPYASSNDGPYLWDPSKGDANKVGGQTGSHVNPSLLPDIIGGNMWENRDNVSVSRPQLNWGSTSDSAIIDGLDIILYNPRSGGLYIYAIHNENSAEDEWITVGKYWTGNQGQGAGAYSSDHSIYVIAKSMLSFWDLNTASSDNRDILVEWTAVGDETSNYNKSYSGIAYDQRRKHFVLWDGTPQVQILTPPEILSTNEWTLEKLSPSGGDSGGEVVWGGVLGKFNYIANEDVFIGVRDGDLGNIWIYKPRNLQEPHYPEKNIIPPLILLIL